MKVGDKNIHIRRILPQLLQPCKQGAPASIHTETGVYEQTAGVVPDQIAVENPERISRQRYGDLKDVVGYFEDGGVDLAWNGHGGELLVSV